MSKKSNSTFPSINDIPNLQPFSFFFPNNVSQSYEQDQNYGQFTIPFHVRMPQQTYMHNLGYYSYPFRCPTISSKNAYQNYHFFNNSYVTRNFPDTSIDYKYMQARTQASPQEQIVLIRNQQQRASNLGIKNAHEFQGCLKQQNNLKIQESQIKSQFSKDQQKFNSILYKSEIKECASSGDYLSRSDRVKRYLIKKHKRTYKKRIVYQCRKSVADNRLRVKGRFVKRLTALEVDLKSKQIQPDVQKQQKHKQ